MRSAIDRDADPQQMIPKLTCLLLKTGQGEFSELVQLRATSPNEALQVLLRGKNMTFTGAVHGSQRRKR